MAGEFAFTALCYMTVVLCRVPSAHLDLTPRPCRPQQLFDPAPHLNLGPHCHLYPNSFNKGDSNQIFRNGMWGLLLNGYNADDSIIVQIRVRVPLRITPMLETAAQADSSSSDRLPHGFVRAGYNWRAVMEPGFRGATPGRLQGHLFLNTHANQSTYAFYVYIHL